MSSILKALKKLERDPPEQDSYQPWTEQIDHKKAVTGRAGKIWRAAKLWRSVPLVLLLAALGWFGFSQKQRLFDWVSAPKSSENHSSAGSNPGAEQEPKANDRSSSKPPPVSPTSKNTNRYAKAEPSTPTGKTSPQAKPAAPPAKKPIAPQSNSPITPVKPATAVSRDAPTRKNAVSVASSTASKKASRSTKPQDTLSRFRESSLKLQAIAWSDDIERRLAVINGRILRQGESVEGFLIKQIRQDDVVVSNGKQSWKLEFGLQN